MDCKKILNEVLGDPVEPNPTFQIVDNNIQRELKKAGIKFSKNRKMNSVSYQATGTDYRIVWDGVGIDVTDDGKSVKFYDKPKINYRKAVQTLSDMLNNENM